MRGRCWGVARRGAAWRDAVAGCLLRAGMACSRSRSVWTHNKFIIFPSARGPVGPWAHGPVGDRATVGFTIITISYSTAVEQSRAAQGETGPDRATGAGGRGQGASYCSNRTITETGSVLCSLTRMSLFFSSPGRYRLMKGGKKTKSKLEMECHGVVAAHSPFTVCLWMKK